MSKSKEEIKLWLGEQPWFPAFAANILRSHNRPYINSIVSGDYGGSTIAIAFSWKTSPEGENFWRNIEKQYREWYDGNNVRERFSVDIKFEPDSKEPYQRKLYVSIENTAYGLPALSIDELSMVGEYINKYLEEIKNGRSL